MVQSRRGNGYAYTPSAEQLNIKAVRVASARSEQPDSAPVQRAPCLHGQDVVSVVWAEWCAQGLYAGRREPFW